MKESLFYFNIIVSLQKNRIEQVNSAELTIESDFSMQSIAFGIQLNPLLKFVNMGIGFSLDNSKISTDSEINLLRPPAISSRPSKIFRSKSDMNFWAELELLLRSKNFLPNVGLVTKSRYVGGKLSLEGTSDVDNVQFSGLMYSVGLRFFINPASR